MLLLTAIYCVKSVYKQFAAQDQIYISYNISLRGSGVIFTALFKEVVVCFVYNNACILLHLAKIRLHADSNFIDFNMTVCIYVVVFI